MSHPSEHGQSSSPAEYFDSHSPISQLGTLWVEGDQLRFLPTEEGRAGAALLFPLSEVKNTKILQNKLHIELIYPNDLARTRLLIVDNTALKIVVEKKLHATKPHAGRALTSWLFDLPLSSKAILALLILPPLILLLLRSMDSLHHFVPESFDKRLASNIAPQIENRYEVCENRELNQFFKDLLTQLNTSPERFEYDVTILKESTVNAFALPAGKIYFFSGLLEKSESPEEVAGILAHEMGHVEKRHGVKALVKTTGIAIIASFVIGSGLEGAELAETLSEIASTILYLSYSRDSEREADEFATKALMQSKVSLQGILDFFSRDRTQTQAKNTSKRESDEERDSLKVLEWMSTHPMDSERAAYLSENLKVQKTIAPPKPLRIKNWEELKLACRN